MGKKSGPAPPPAPDPTTVSQAQTQSNIETAQANQKLNMINTYGPNGSVVYGADPNAPGGYSQTTTLSPDQQQISNLGNQANIGALGLANDQIGRIGNALGTPLSTNGLPQLSGGPQTPGLQRQIGDTSSIQMQVGDVGNIQTGFDMGPALQYGFNQGQQVQGQVGGNQDVARMMAAGANYQQAASRLDPRFETADKQLETRLANQGLSMNSDAYQNARDQFGRERNDAYNQAAYSAIGAGEQAAQGQFNRELAQGQFANQAAAQQYGQGLGASQFYNQTAGQQYGQNKGAGEFANNAQQQQYAQQLASMQAANQAQQQQFGQQADIMQLGNAAAGQQYNMDMQNAQFGNQARQQGLQERAYLQNQPINQFSALMAGNQVQGPQGIQYTPAQQANTDVMGAYAMNQQAQQNAYQAQMQNRSSMMGGLFQLGSAALMASDRRVKTDIKRVGVLDNGVAVYSYRYKWGGPAQIGVMAQELADVRPDAVHDLGGILGVNYGAL